MKNWKTNLCGLVVALATAIGPCLSSQWQPVAVAVGGLAGSIGFLCCTDAGRKKTPPADPPANE